MSRTKILLVAGILALAATPAAVLAAPGGNQGHGQGKPPGASHGHKGGTGASGTTGATGTTGTSAATGTTGSTGATGATGRGATNPARMCKGMSKKHVHGMKGTPYSRCVSAAAKLRHHVGATGSKGTTGSTGGTGSTGATGAT
jgi:hypothetical protein